MKVVSIIGSPRPGGNTVALTEAVTSVLEQSGAQVSSYMLNKLNVRGCQACMACKGDNDRCVLNDDLTQVLEDVIESDIIIMAFPVYWGEMTGQMKLFIDRTYSFLKPGYMEREDKHRLPPGKKLVWIQVQGAENADQFDDIFARYNQFFEQLNYFSKTYLLRGCGVNALGAVSERPDLLAEARDIGKELIS
ncbi:MAG: flavodoxin family protein [Desulforhopalus sp.]